MTGAPAILAFVLAVPLLAQAESGPASLPASPALEEKLEAIRAKHGVPALAGAVTTADRVLAIGAAGVRKKGSPERATVNDLWHLGSCTKSMTATMLARLVEREKLGWDSTVAAVFPDLDGEMREAYRPVTVEQLLGHRSGMPADLSGGGLWGRLWQRKGTPTEQRRELLEGVLATEPVSPPGTKYLYSNAGFAVAGHMAERATGRTFEDLMREHLFEPAGMKSAGFGAPGRAGCVEQPWGHTVKGDAVEPGPNADNPPAIGPAGTVHASLSDWAKYAALHLRGAKASTDYLNPESFARIQARPAEGDYAFGWGHHDRPWANGHVLSHSGSNTMWFCVIWLAPERGAAFLAVCNAGGEGPARATDEAIGELIMAVKDQLPLRKR